MQLVCLGGELVLLVGDAALEHCQLLRVRVVGTHLGFLDLLQALALDVEEVLLLLRHLFEQRAEVCTLGPEPPAQLGGLHHHLAHVLRQILQFSDVRGGNHAVERRAHVSQGLAEPTAHFALVLANGLLHHRLRVLVALRGLLVRDVELVNFLLHALLVLAHFRLEARHDAAVRGITQHLLLVQLLHLRRGVGIQLLLQVGQRAQQLHDLELVFGQARALASGDGLQLLLHARRD